MCYVTVAKPNREFLQLLLLRRRLLQNLLLNGSALVRRAPAGGGSSSKFGESDDFQDFHDVRALGGRDGGNGRLISFESFNALGAGGNGDDLESRGCGEGVGALANRSAKVRGSRVYIKPGGLSLAQDAPWTTGGSVDQAETLNSNDVTGRRVERERHFDSFARYGIKYPQSRRKRHLMSSRDASHRMCFKY